MLRLSSQRLNSALVARPARRSVFSGLKLISNEISDRVQLGAILPALGGRFLSAQGPGFGSFQAFQGSEKVPGSRGLAFEKQPHTGASNRGGRKERRNVAARDGGRGPAGRMREAQSGAKHSRLEGDGSEYFTGIDGWANGEEHVGGGRGDGGRWEGRGGSALEQNRVRGQINEKQDVGALVKLCLKSSRQFDIADTAAGEKWSETQYQNSRECVLIFA
jgi:hypothetical protein